MMLSKGCLTLQQCRASLLHKPVTISNSVNTRLFSDNINNSEDAKESSTKYHADKAEESAGFFSDGVKATVGTVLQKAKEAIGVEKPLGKEGAGSMEPAGVMENKQSPADQYANLIGKHKEQNEQLMKGAKPADLYRENAKATSATNAKPGGDDLLDKQTHDR
ncbi:hypothetical protein WJX75_006738 [Coccomyxa subellipsoidea]|uniref:SMP domain-containing protein n=1 Tax=Coccomyxa subellipsoidea TaxID=248742 RepID=A0ABR2YUC2_9CHLO